jgi:hypothetical protein
LIVLYGEVSSCRMLLVISRKGPCNCVRGEHVSNSVGIVIRDGNSPRSACPRVKVSRNAASGNKFTLNTDRMASANAVWLIGTVMRSRAAPAVSHA